MNEFWDIPWNWIFSVMAAIMLFLHGLASFSDEITRLGGERMRSVLAHVTRRDWVGSLMGALATMVVQSSSAVTSMAVGLAHNQTLAPRGALAIMIGANVGTTLTAWLVAFKVSGLGPVFLTLGGALVARRATSLAFMGQTAVLLWSHLSGAGSDLSGAGPAGPTP